MGYLLRRFRAACSCAAMAFTFAATSEAQEPVFAQFPWEAGARVYLHWSPHGTLVGDIQGQGVYAGYRVRPKWVFQAGVDWLSYDLEEPIDVTGLLSDDPEPVDAFVEVLRLRMDAVYHLGASKRWDPYVSAGIAYHNTESDEADGMTVEGDPYHLEVETPSTFGANLVGGVDLRLGDRYSAGLAAAYGRTLEGYTVTDTLSGMSGRVKALAPWGVLAVLAAHF